MCTAAHSAAMQGMGDDMSSQSHRFLKLGGKSGLSSLCVYLPQKHLHALSPTTTISLYSFIQTDRLLIRSLWRVSSTSSPRLLFCELLLDLRRRMETLSVHAYKRVRLATPFCTAQLSCHSALWVKCSCVRISLFLFVVPSYTRRFPLFLPQSLSLEDPLCWQC